MRFAMDMEVTAGELAHTIYPHPTVSEIIQEAMMGITGKPVHIK